MDEQFLRNMINIKYSKTKTGRDGLYQLDFAQLTPTLLDKLESESQSEIDILKRIVIETPEVLSNPPLDSPWEKIGLQLIKFNISTKIVNLYEYKDRKYSLGNYLKVRGNDEKNMELIITSQLVFIALAITRHKLENNFEQALIASELLFGCGLLMGEALFEDDIMAGCYNTTQASLAKTELKQKRIEKTKVEALKLRVKYPKITKKAISKKIYEEIGVAEITVLDYLKKIKL